MVFIWALDKCGRDILSKFSSEKVPTKYKNNAQIAEEESASRTERLHLFFLENVSVNGLSESAEHRRQKVEPIFTLTR